MIAAGPQETAARPSSTGGGRFWLPALVAVAVVILTQVAARSPQHPVAADHSAADAAALDRSVSRVDDWLSRRWSSQGLTPAESADELTVLRRLSLALHGTVPSLEELRRFEGDDEPRRLARWTHQLLEDRRFADYFAVRLSRTLIGAEEGQFLLFRRDRFQQWLAEELRSRTPYDELVRQMIAGQGLWTGEPQTNFMTQAAVQGRLDPNELAGRTVRAFLGQRIDCAQCHNHPFKEWKQPQFEGLAACFGQARIRITGIEDHVHETWSVEDRQTLERREVSPAVPFGTEWWPAEGTARERLAAWVTHPQNRRFERATANLVWGLVFGRPWRTPVDDLDDPGPADQPDLLDLLGQEFRDNHYDLTRLVAVIAACRAFRLASQHPAFDGETGAELVEEEFAAFPLVRLRPEQVIGAMVQATSLKTIDQNSQLFTRLLKLIREVDFVREYGPLGADELTAQVGTIRQALLRMNGRFAREVLEANPFSASGRIAGLAPDDHVTLETIYLCCLTRRPSATEQKFFANFLTEARGDDRSRAVEDIFWTLFNAGEFSWNH